MSLPHSRIEAVFDALLECPSDERTRRGKALCGDDERLWQEVKSLLAAADKAQGFLSVGPGGVCWQQLTPFEPDALWGQRFGAYEIVGELGRGGMGVVFLAERADGHYQGQAAIKVSRNGLAPDSTVQRFHAERQCLAHLRHPNIAQLLDGGTSECGHPYLVMEYIAGDAIDHYCDSVQLPVHGILRLMVQVCDAVQYAHQNLVVHCDLKPANIMVTDEGVPKLLDFGIATLLNSSVLPDATEIGVAEREPAPFTPEFAAPEQVFGKPVSTTVDVYSLGVVLYRLLTGKLPYQLDGVAQHNAGAAIANAPIALPSEVVPAATRKRLRGDLDCLVMKALHRDPRQRYLSVQALAEDIGRYLAGLPIRARKPAYRYRARKFLARHRLGVALATLATLSLVLGTIVSSWHWRVAQEKHLLSEQQLEKVYELASLMVFELPRHVAAMPGSTVLREKLIRKGVSYLDELAAANTENPTLQRDLATAYFELARLQGNPITSNLGDPALALDSSRKALAIQEDLLGRGAVDDNLRIELAATYMYLGGLQAVSFSQMDLAHERTNQCLSLLDPIVAGTGGHKVLKQLLGCYTLAAHWRNVDGQVNRAASYLRSAEALFARLGSEHAFVRSPDGQRLLFRIHEEWAAIEAANGDPQAALLHEQQRLAIIRTQMAHLPSADRHQGAAYHALAARHADLNQFSAAEQTYRRAIEHWQNWQREFPSDVSATQALVLIHAELAGLHQVIATTSSQPEAHARARNQVCASYAQSLANLRQLPPAQAEFPRRYSWSPKPEQIVSLHKIRCASATY